MCTPPGLASGSGKIHAEGVEAVYLTRVRLPDDYHYILRETYSDNGILKSRDLMDMGRDPSAHIHYPGGSGFYFDAAVEDTLRAKGVPFTSEEIEDIFEPYLRARFRDIIGRFRNRRSGRVKVECDLERLVPDQRRVHIFDARRLYYLRFGRVDSGELGTRHWKFLNVFLCKSRDEIENVLEAMERRLPPREYATYVYSSLGVPLFYPQHMRDYPLALDREEIDGHIVEELCRLNADEVFFLGVESRGRDRLHPYLTKYAWLYFDSGFQSGTWPEEPLFGADFHRPPAPPPRTVSVECAREVFGISAEQFSHMTKKEITRIYRRKAKKMHPDRGGVHDEFVKLSEAYEQLLALKK
ncbi:MAG: J domain-containing protein [Syntrophobacteraceae bacterium]